MGKTFLGKMHWDIISQRQQWLGSKGQFQAEQFGPSFSALV